jgi:carboxypeptidase family protein/TonB-dependent receptor-like protein
MTLSRFLRVVSPSLFIVLGFACGVVGQTETATVSGLVTDRTGAAVPGAEVRLQSVERGTITTTTTNDAGIYVFPSVQPGQYQISIQKQGFKQVDLLGLVVNVQDHLEQNLRLEVGSIAESVTVAAAASMINTTDASVSTVVDRQFVENMPLNGRSFQTLIQLTPGVVLTPSTPTDAGQFSVNGQRTVSNYWTVDGVSANIGVTPNGTPGNGFAGSLPSFSVLGGTNSLVSVDALQEFRIQTSTYAPEFGRTPGAQISIVTRSGTNQFHGTVFDYLRNDALDANNWFNTAVTPALPKAQERQNDFGGTFSGPILKAKTFFFFSYEGLRLRLPQTALTTVPCDNTCQAFGNARAMAVAQTQPFLNAYPLPNGPEVFTPCTPNVNGCPASGKQPTGSAQFNASYSNPATLDAYSLRTDHKVSDKLNLFVRYNYSPSDIKQRGFFAALSDVAPAHILTQTATVGSTWLVSATTSNDLRFNYSRTNGFSSSFLDNFGGAVPLASLPLPNPDTAQDSLFIFDIFALAPGPINEGQNAHQLQRQFNIVDNISLQKGPHSLKFGVDFRRLSPIYNPPSYDQFAAFLDVPSSESANIFAASIQAFRGATLLFHNLSVFAEDTWRVAPRLTLTYGLRWDVDFAPSSLEGPSLPAVTGFDVNNLSNLALAPAGTPPFKSTYGNFAPRIGIAYQFSQAQNWETVVRGGFGVFYDLATSQAGNNVSFNYPFGASKLVLGPAIGGTATFPLSSSDAAPPTITAASLSSSTLFAFDPSLTLPYTLQWNVALQQGLGTQQAITASYVASVGRRLLQSASISSPNPSFGQADIVGNTATSNYNALQVQFQRRVSRGLQALISYTWSHSIDTASAGSFGGASNTLVPAINPSANRGPSDFDIRNAFSAGVTYDLPAPKINAFTNAILRGWSLQSVVQARSAPPANIFDGKFFSLLNGVAQVRPDLVAGVPLYLFGPQYPGGKAFNPAAFTDPPTMGGKPLRQGDLSRNAVRTFCASQWDFGVHRTFPIHESLTLQFRAEMFNLLNHPNFGPPVADLNNSQFGRSTQLLGQSLAGGNVGSGAFSPLYQIGGPRSIQLVLRLQL